MRQMEIKSLSKKDYGKTIDFAIRGMHLDWYIKNKTILRLYGRYFLYLELNKATQIFAAYEGDVLIGVLLAEMYHEKPIKTSCFQKFYVKLINLIQHTFVKQVDDYDNANKEMLGEFIKKHKPDGELIFLAADPDANRKGIGTALLQALAEAESGKRVFLFTDSGCTYQFYEHRGFARYAERHIKLQLANTIPLDCYLYQKVI